MSDDEVSEFFNIDLESLDDIDFGVEVSVKKPSIKDFIADAENSPLLAIQDIEPEIDEAEIDNSPEVQAAINELKEAEKAVESAETASESVKIVINELTQQRAEIMAQIAELNRKVFEIDVKKREILDSTFTARSELNQAKRRRESAERTISIVKQNVAARKRMEYSVEQYARIAEKYTWYTGIDSPDGKTYKILNHQWDGAKFLATSGRAILGDEMGLGKTLTAIAALDLVGSKRALVICPAEVTSNFMREIKRWAPHRNVVNINGKTKSERNAILSMAGFFEPVIVVVNYEAWRKDLSLIQRLIDIQFDTLIADEAHSVKGTNTDAFSGVSAISLADNVCPYCGGLLELNEYGRRCEKDNYYAGQSVVLSDVNEYDRQFVTRSVKNMWLMTGTPILNAPEDLYPMLYLIDPRGFPYKNAYLRDYCMYNSNKQKYYFAPGGLESLVRRISGHYLARNLSDAGVQLPPQDIIYHNIEFDDDSYKLQQDIIRQLTEYSQVVLEENNKMTTIGVLALLTRLRQANVWPGGIKVYDYDRDMYGMPITHDDFGNPLEKKLVFDASSIRESIKIDKVKELVNEFVGEERKRVAVFSQFKTALAELETQLTADGYRVVRFDGDTHDSVKDAIKRNWDKSSGEEAKWDIVLANYKTGGVGLNLTAATHTIILDEEWNPGKRDQAYARTHRMGQDEHTFVHVLRVADTVDTWLANLIAQKEEMIGGFDEATIDIQAEMLKAIKDGEIQ